jgi:hypothetical protein
MTKTEWINKNKSLVIQNPKLKQALGLDEGIESSNLQQAIENFLSQHEGANEAVALDAIDYLARAGQLEKFANETPYLRDQFDELAEGWESGPEEYEEPYDDADDAYDRQRQEKIDTEAEKEWAKLPKVTTYKLYGRGPNMEPNYAFGDEFDSMEKAIEYRKQIMADPKTPHPEHIGIHTITRVVDKQPTNEAVYTAPMNREDYDAKMSALQDLQNDPNTANDEELQRKIIIYMDNLQKVAHKNGWLAQSAEESRGHTVIANKLKDIERAKKFASGELKIPTPQERRAELEKPKKQVKEYGADNNVTPYGRPKTDPKQAQAVAQGTQAFKSATGITAPNTNIAQALDDISQGKTPTQQTVKTLEPVLQDLATIGQTPSIAQGTFKTAMQQANQKQVKQLQAKK